ncbi:Protein TsgA [Buchnera aphidicola (Thelaxes suberi)]|uniref:MFS transporter TsgA n=1 Tax=Buchnera aphidicola TaxID=9 RepID=UPI003463E71C
MIKNDVIKITLIGFLSYFLTGSLIVVTGTIIGDIAQYFKKSIPQMSFTFTYLNIGILISMLIEIFLINKISIKKQLIFGFILTILAICGLISSHQIITFAISIFIFGIISGMTMSIGTYLITNLYTGSERGRKLLLTDSCFSLAGIIIPIYASKAISNHLHWYMIYIFISIIYCIIMLLTINTDFNKIFVTKHHPIKNLNITNYPSIWLNISILSCTVFLYILGQLSFISWVPEYLIHKFNLSIIQSGKIISIFWMFYMIGMWFFSFILKFFELQKILVILSGLSTLFMYLFIQTNTIFLLYLYISFLGFVSSAIYSISITIASLQTKYPSSKLINLILIAGTLGSLFTFIITKPLIITYGIKTALIASNILYCLVFLCNIFLNIINNCSKTKTIVK